MLPFKEIHIGDDLDIDIRQSITQEMIDRWAQVSVDFNPLHIDPAYGKTSKFGSTICHGTLTITFIMEMLTLWMGKGWLSGGQLLGVRFVAPVRPFDTVRPGGKVVGKRIENDRKLVDCEVWLENQDGVKVITGRATGEVE